MNDQLIVLLQKKISNCIGPSTGRNMGPSGTIGIARGFLKNLDLDKISKKNRESFEIAIDEITYNFQNALPIGGQYWGSCRKFLNIFLRETLYNCYLRERYNLEIIEPWLEIPLDSHVAKGLHAEQDGNILPRWNTVIGLSKEDNFKYQQFAEKLATSKGISRVHLDLFYWRGDHVTK